MKVTEELRSDWQPPVIGPEAETELLRIRNEWLGHLAGSPDDFGDHGEDIAWLLDYITENQK